MSFLLTARSCVKTYLLCCVSEVGGKATFRTQPNHDGDYLLVFQPLFVMQMIVGTDCFYFSQAMRKINLAQQHAIPIMAQHNMNNTFKTLNLNSINKNFIKFQWIFLGWVCSKSVLEAVLLINSGMISLRWARGITLFR